MQTALLDDHDLLCKTQTWLTSEIPNQALILSSCKVYRKDRPSNNVRSEHGGVLIAVKSGIRHELINLNFNCSDYLVISLTGFTGSVMLCFIYNAPGNSPYRWSLEHITNPLSSLMEVIDGLESCVVLVTGDIIPNSADWSTMCSSHECEAQFLDTLFQLNFSNSAPTQLYVVLCNDPDLVKNSTISHVHKN